WGSSDADREAGRQNEDHRPGSSGHSLWPGRANALRERYRLRQSSHRAGSGRGRRPDGEALPRRHRRGRISARGPRSHREGRRGHLVITPERVLTQDFSQETPWFGKAWLVLKRVLPPG